MNQNTEKSNYVINFIKKSMKPHNARMLHVIQYGYLVLKNTRLGVEIFEASLVDDFDSDCLVVGFTKATIHLAELTRAEKLLRIDSVLFVQALLFVFGR